MPLLTQSRQPFHLRDGCLRTLQEALREKTDPGHPVACLADSKQLVRVFLATSLECDTDRNQRSVEQAVADEQVGVLQHGAWSGPTVAATYANRPRREPDAPHADQLRTAMAAHLEREHACFDLAVQFQTDPEQMPVEDASRLWSEQDSPLRPVARLTIPAQAFDSEVALARCEAETFDPWRGIADHRPLGQSRPRQDHLESSVWIGAPLP